MYFKIHHEGWSYFITSLILTIVIFPFFNSLGFIFSILTIFIFYFFRDPIRVIPSDDLVVSPADGKITYIGIDNAPNELNLNQKFIKISIFLSIFNVHVNRMPIKGIIKKIVYVHGKFINASLDKSSHNNERNIVLLEKDNKDQFIVTQIAGLIARRIICNIKENQEIFKGDKFGIIKFGSRVDLYMPLNYKSLVTLGQNVIAGETIIANPNLIKEINSFVKK